MIVDLEGRRTSIRFDLTHPERESTDQTSVSRTAALASAKLYCIERSLRRLKQRSTEVKPAPVRLIRAGAFVGDGAEARRV